MGLLKSFPKRAADPARAALADAIAEHQEAVDYLAGTERAKQTADQAVWAARSAVDAAEAGIEDAKAAATAHLIETAMGAVGDPPTTIRSAREALQDAQDALASARDAQTALAPRIEPAAMSVRIRKTRVEEAAREVLRQHPGILALITRTEKLHRELVDASLQLAWLWDAHALVDRDVPLSGQMQPISAVRTLVNHLSISPVNCVDVCKQVSGAAPWRMAFEALMTDADATLPG